MGRGGDEEMVRVVAWVVRHPSVERTTEPEGGDKEMGRIEN